MKKKVVVGISGGVDSAVAALLLKKQGYDVVGLFMNNWREQDNNDVCTAEKDFFDVKSICRVLDIRYYPVDFSKEYYDLVFKHFISEYKKGRTPNPDVLCNKEIKFDVFFNHAMKIGADFVATGHYADTEIINGLTYLKRAKDEDKDQTYFLNQLNEKQIAKVIFPLADLKKKEVRAIAEENHLPVAKKKDSTGICFIGERHFREFLSKYIPMRKGDICDLKGRVLGQHNGVFYYTIGQRRGLGIGGQGTGEPWFVVDKDIKKNILYVVQGEDKRIYKKAIITDKFNFITKKPDKQEFAGTVRIRHRQPLQKAKCFLKKDGTLMINFEKPQKGVAEGQYAVVYNGRYCLGGGVIEKKK